MVAVRKQKYILGIFRKLEKQIIFKRKVKRSQKRGKASGIHKRGVGYRSYKQEVTR